MGGTLSLRTFPGGTTYEQALVAWNQKTGTDLQCWKIYYQEGEFGTGNDAQVQTMVDGDIQALISVKPSIKPSSSDRAALSTLLAGFQRRGLNAQVCLWQEIGPKVMTAAQYHTYVRYYGPAIRQFYPLVFDAPGHVDPRVWKEYDPGHSQVDGYAVDYYGSAYAAGGRLEEMAALAGSLPLGIWELGNTVPPAKPSTSQVQRYLAYVNSFLTRRKNQGLPVGSVAWYNAASQGTLNEIVGTDLCPWASIDLAAYHQLYWSLNPPPG